MEHGFGFQLFERTVLQPLEGILQIVFTTTNSKIRENPCASVAQTSRAFGCGFAALCASVLNQCKSVAYFLTN